MKTFAQVDENNTVLNVGVFADDNTPAELEWSEWYETSDVSKQRASSGDTFVPVADGYPTGLFYSPSPHNTWVLDEDYEWQPPADKPYPDGFGEEGNLWWWDDLIDDWDQRNPAPPES
jgi:hypothetical protein